MTSEQSDIQKTIDDLMSLWGGIRRPKIVREMIATVLKAGREDDGKVDLKLMRTTLAEMRYTAKIFSSYRNLKKITIFGSARTGANQRIYRMAHDFGKKLSRRGYMTITGGGPGIMQAVNEGAGPEQSFGVSIRLPFEQKMNLILDGDPKNIMYKYFFNRKVAFLKESDGIAIFPGGFGTLDEAMETLTLLQTGKRNPMPLLFIDEPGGRYWKNWFRFCHEDMAGAGYISKSDFNLVDLLEDVDAAVDRIDRFYHRYHSIRYIRGKAVLRLTSSLSQNRIDDLKQSFADILTEQGDLYLSGSFPEEEDEPEIKDLSRLVVDFNLKDFGRLKALIDAVNAD